MIHGLHNSTIYSRMKDLHLSQTFSLQLITFDYLKDVLMFRSTLLTFIDLTTKLLSLLVISLILFYKDYLLKCSYL